MNKSSSIASIAKAIALFHVKMGKVSKDAKNPFFNSKYASLSNILEAIETPLSEAGLTFSQFPTDEHGLTTILMHGESGEWMESNYAMRPTKDDPQGRGSAITYQRRYALAAVLGLNIDEDDDGNKASEPRTQSAEKNQAQASVEKKWLNENTPEFNAAINKLRSGATTMEKIKAGMKVSKAVEAKLNEALQTVNN